MLRVYTKIVCFFTLFLIFAGGMVTSTSSGLAVPDWPLSYGTLFPPMIGGVFYEHGHRMIASFVGLLTLILAVWIWRTEKRKWVRLLGVCALFAVILQGILGGITVLFYLPTPVSVSHATLAQTFFLLTILIAYTQSKERKEREGSIEHHHRGYIKYVVLFIGLIYCQLIFGAIMRHTGAGLAIPDFPTMGGFWLPRFNEEMLYVINDWRFDHDLAPVNKLQVFYHFLHRCMAFVILIGVCILHKLGVQYYQHSQMIRKNLILLDIILVIQILLGVTTILTVKHPVITSLHVVNGALFLGAAFLLFLRVSPLSLNKT